MSRQDEIRNIRIGKKDGLEKKGINPYPAKVKKDFDNAEVTKRFAAIRKAKPGKTVHLAGRIMSIRSAGKIYFIEFSDGTGRFQAVLRIDEAGHKQFNDFKKYFDIGDFAQFSGKLFVTKTRAKSILVKKITMVGKTLLPLPEKWHGIQDVEERYRKRHLDVLTNQETYDRFALRSKIIKETRSFFDEKGFMEVETPILQGQAGGAMAKTFNTHHNDLDIPMVLRISLELHHKMIMAGGYPAIYEIGKNFRNEGSDPTHLQEFTMLEWYAAYKNLDDNARWTEQLIKRLVKLTGKKKFTVYDEKGKGTEINMAGKWQKKTFAELVKKHAKLDALKATRKEIEAKAKEYGMSSAEMSKLGDANLLDFIYKKSARDKIVDPTFVMNYPSDLVPLAQKNEDGTAEMFQLIVAGAEIVKSFAELVDPFVQRELLEKQAMFKDGGDDEAMEVDEEFLEVMEYGMPPMTGFGMGIDRIVAILSEQRNLRDVIFFPIMKPEIEPLSKKQAEKVYRAKKIIMLADPTEGYGVTANAMGQLRLPDKDGKVHYPDGFYGMSNLAATRAQMAEFVGMCHKEGVQAFDFSDIMRRAHTDEQMLKGYKEVKTKDVGYLAVGAIVDADFQKEWLSKLDLFS